MKKLAALVSLSLCLFIGAAQAVTYYVDASTTEGNVVGDGSVGSPWQTITYAMTQVSSADVVYAAAGSYNAAMSGSSETFPISVTTGVYLKSNAAPTLLATIDAGAEVRAVTLNAVTSLDGFTVKNSGASGTDGAVYLSGFSYALNNVVTCSASSANGIYIGNDADGSGVLNNHIWMGGSNTRGIYANGAQGNYCENILVQGNTVEVGSGGLSYGAIYLYGYCVSYSVTDNLVSQTAGNSHGIYTNWGDGSITSNEVKGFANGIYGQPGGTQTLNITNNTIINFTAYGIQSTAWGGGTPTTNIKNNIICGNPQLGDFTTGNSGIYASSGHTTNSTYNDIWNVATVYDGGGTVADQTGDITSYPRFITGEGLYKIGTDSPCATGGEGGTYMGRYAPSGTSSFTSESWVDAVSGNDSTGDGSSGNPWKTVGKGLSTTAGTVHIKAGTYNAANGDTFPYTLAEDQVVDSVATPTTSATIDAASGSARVFGLAPYATIEGCTIKTDASNTSNGAVYLLDAPTWVLNNVVSCSATSSGRGIYADAVADGAIISGNNIWTGGSSYGINIANDCDGVTIEANTIEAGASGRAISLVFFNDNYTINNNLLLGAGSGNGIYQGGRCGDGSITSNEVRGFQYGMYLYLNGTSNTAAVSNNTIVDFSGYGIYCAAWSGTPVFTVKNNILSGDPSLGSFTENNYGLYRSGGTLNSTYNCLWNNAENYYNASDKTGDITAFPRFITTDGLYRIGTDSPCAASGEAGTYMGRYAPSGTSNYTSESWVDDDGSDSNSGTFASPWKTIGKGLSQTYGTVHLKAGTYNAANGDSFPYTLAMGQQLNSVATPTTNAIVDAAGSSARVFGLAYATTLEGLSINTDAASGSDAAVYLMAQSQVLNNIVTCSASSASGIYSDDTADYSVIKNNRVTMSTYGYGIYVRGNSSNHSAGVLVDGNTVEVSSYSNAIYAADYCENYDIRNNRVKGAVNSTGKGIYFKRYNGDVSSNEVVGFQDGIYGYLWPGYTANIFHNTSVKNSDGIQCDNSGTVNIYDNIVAGEVGGYSASGTRGIYTNAVTTNSTYNTFYAVDTTYEGTVSGKSGDQDKSPQFTDATNNDFTLAENSPCINSASDGSDRGCFPFTGTMAAYVIQPNGGESINGYDNYTIQWYATIETGSYDHIEIYLSTDEGSSYPYTLASNEANDGSYSWTVNNLPTIDARVKIIAVGSSITDESDSDFTILNGDLSPPSVEVSSPSNGLYWAGGSQYNISFSCSDSRGLQADSANLYYTTGEVWIEIATGQATNAAYPWTVPLLDTSEAKVRVTAVDVNNNVGTGESSGFFTIDSTSPDATSIVLSDISSGLTAETNSLTVSLSAQSVTADPYLMRLAENSGFTTNSTGWISYANPTTFTFTWGNGTREVYYQMRDQASNESLILSDSIIVDLVYYYVDAVSGSDSNTGSSEGDAWKTITYALSSTEAGDIILCSAGTYDATNGETFSLNIDNNKLVSGESAATCFIKGSGSPPVIISGGGEIKNFTIISTSTQSGDAAISLTGAGNVTGNIITWQGTPPTEVIGISYASGSSGTLSLNTIYDVATGVKLDTTGSVTADHNTITYFTDHGVSAVQGSHTVTNNVISASPVLNELAAQGSVGIYNDGTASVSANYNEVWGNDTGYTNVAAGANSVSDFGMWVNPDNKDFRVYGTTSYASSPLLGAGSDGQTIGSYTNSTGVAGNIYRDTGYVDSVNGTDSVSAGYAEDTAYKALDYANNYAVNLKLLPGDYTIADDTTFAVNDGRTIYSDDRNTATISGSSRNLIDLGSNTIFKLLEVVGTSPQADSRQLMTVYGDSALIDDTNLSFDAAIPADNTILVKVATGAANTTISDSLLYKTDQAVRLYEAADLARLTLTEFKTAAVINDNTGTSDIDDSLIVQAPKTLDSPEVNAVGVKVLAGKANLRRLDFYRTATEYNGQVNELDQIYRLDPKFVDAAAYDYRLQSNSPLIGLGDGGTSIGGVQPDYSGDWIACHITTPDGGETLGIGNTYAITWYASKGSTAIDKIDLYLSTDNGVTFAQTIADNLTNTGGTNSAQTGLYAWTVPDIETDEARVRVVATAGTSSASDGSDTSFTIERGGENIPPNINIRVGGFTIIDNDYIDRDTTFDIYLTDNVSLDASTATILLDGASVSYTTVYDLGASMQLEHRAAALAEGTHDLEVMVADTSGNYATKEVNDLKVEVGAAKVVGPVLVDPTPFAPRGGGQAKIAYHLNKNVATTLYLYSPTRIEWTRKFSEGANGGKAGYNEVSFGGMSDTDPGFVLGNGIYVLRIVAEGRAIGNGHLVIYE